MVCAMCNKRDCESCKYCSVRKAQYTDVMVTDCERQNDISKLTFDEIRQHIENGTCAFYEGRK